MSAMSAKCHKQTHAPQQKPFIRSPRRRRRGIVRSAALRRGRLELAERHLDGVQVGHKSGGQRGPNAGKLIKPFAGRVAAMPGDDDLAAFMAPAHKSMPIIVANVAARLYIMGR